MMDFIRIQNFFLVIVLNLARLKPNFSCHGKHWIYWDDCFYRQVTPFTTSVFESGVQSVSASTCSRILFTFCDSICGLTP